ncbi:MAG TPA: ABC transporter permease [Bryobacteraceae bacterium]|nr:ABC transporter permease [Bryobacteraceae bacterium]
MTRKPPRLACFLVRDEVVLGDLIEEYNTYHRSSAWFWKQTWSLLWFTGHAEQPERKRPVNLLSDFWTDFRYTLRTFTKNPGFAVVVILAIALGVGANTTIFTLLNSLALRPLPVPDSRRVVGVYQIFQGHAPRNVNGEVSLFSYSEYQRYRDQNRVFSGLAAYYPFFRATLAGETPRDMSGELATCNYFRVLGVQPVIGRGFADSDCAAPGLAPVVVLSDSAWRSVFASDPSMIGKVITLNRVRLTVIGVAPPGFHGGQISAADFWAPLTLDPLIHEGDSLKGDNLSWLVLAGRLKNGVTLDQARANLSVIAGQIDHLHPGRKTTLSVDVATFMSVPEERQGVLTVAKVIFAAVSLVLLIACANVANLLLSRSSARQKEIAVRVSVGASRGRLVRQLLTESVVLALPGGLLGGMAAALLLKPLFLMLISHLPSEVPPLTLDLSPDLTVLAYTLALTLLTGIVFGLAPALQASRPDLTMALRMEGSGHGAHGSHGWLRSALVVAQVSVCLILLITAGLLARGVQVSQTIEPGFRTDHIFSAKFDLEQQHYNELRAMTFHRLLMERAASLPGVDGVAETVVVPLSMNSWGNQITLPGRPDKLQDRFTLVSPEFFSVLGIPVIHGRNFTQLEIDGNARVAIVMESTARKLWPGQDPLGKTFSDDEKKPPPIEVVGVARDSHASSLSELDSIFFYFPLKADAQVPLKLLVHSKATFEQTAKALRAAVRSIDPNVLVDVRSMDQNLEMYRTPGVLVTELAGALGGFALLLASIGIYSVVSHAVSRRVREIGIRMSLGAERRDVMGLVLRGAMRPVMIGIALGIMACAAVSRVLSGVLYGVSPLDPAAFAGVTLFLAGVALLASYLPARRATRIDPMQALRHD